MYVLAVGSLGVYGILLRGWRSNSKYASEKNVNYQRITVRAWALACFKRRKKMAVAAHTQHSEAFFSDTYCTLTVSRASRATGSHHAEASRQSPSLPCYVPFANATSPFGLKPSLSSYSRQHSFSTLPALDATYSSLSYCGEASPVLEQLPAGLLV
jgi:hypothetical protein